jgi:hypothetical protein
MVVTQRIYFWNNEEIGAPPAVRTKDIYFKNLVSATLHADINLYNAIHLVHLDGISLNKQVLPGSSGSEGAHKDYDVTAYIQNGTNEVKLDYSGLWIIGPWGIVTLFIDVVAEEVSPTPLPTPPPTPPPTELPKLEWWQWLLIGGIGLTIVCGVVYYLAKK